MEIKNTNFKILSLTVVIILISGFGISIGGNIYYGIKYQTVIKHASAETFRKNAIAFLDEIEEFKKEKDSK